MGGHILLAAGVVHRSLGYLFLGGAYVHHHLVCPSFFLEAVESPAHNLHCCAYGHGNYDDVALLYALVFGYQLVHETDLQGGCRIHIVAVGSHYPVGKLAASKVNRHRTAYQTETNNSNIHIVMFYMAALYSPSILRSSMSGRTADRA